MPPTLPPLSTSSQTNNRALPYLLVVTALALIYILLPFYAAILWATIIALLFAPLYRWLLLHMGQRRNLAASVTLMLALIVVVLPLLLVAGSLALQASLLYAQLQSGELNVTDYFRHLFNALPDGVTAVLDRFGLVSFNTLQRRITAALTQGTQFVATQTFLVGQSTFQFGTDVVVAIYLAFFLIREGDVLGRSAWQALPLAQKHRQALRKEFTAVIRATVKGNLLVAVIQGTLGALALGVLGVRGALLWGVLMMFLSLLPALGAALVWAPIAVYFLLVGALWKGLLLTAFGVLIIGLVDNLLRPRLVGKDTRMPDYVVMISTLGGMAVFGINGLVLGPLIAALFIAVWRIGISTRREPN